jgi:succinoglycan biosynthesis protein ExoM
MLAACLQSIMVQRLPPDVSLVLIVIENDDQAYSRHMVESLAVELAAPPVHYHHEPRPGIPIARNRALALALQHDPDWIGFIDDDEVASPDWIRHFAEAAASVTCDVLQGPVEYRYAPGTPAWMPLPSRKYRATGRPLRTAATSNTFMRARLARPDGLGLRFSEAMRFTGGSDNEYFYRAADQGARICWMNEAVVYENVPEHRTTVRWQLARSRRVAANCVAIQRRRVGLLRSTARYVPKYGGRLLSGAMITPVAAAISLIAPHTGKRMLVSALRNVWSGVGGLGAYFKLQPEPYRNIDNEAFTEPAAGSKRVFLAGYATSRLVNPLER